MTVLVVSLFLPYTVSFNIDIDLPQCQDESNATIPSTPIPERPFVTSHKTVHGYPTPLSAAAVTAGGPSDTSLLRTKTAVPVQDQSGDIKPIKHQDLIGTLASKVASRAQSPTPNPPILDTTTSAPPPPPPVKQPPDYFSSQPTAVDRRRIVQPASRPSSPPLPEKHLVPSRRNTGNTNLQTATTTTNSSGHSSTVSSRAGIEPLTLSGNSSTQQLPNKPITAQEKKDDAELLESSVEALRHKLSMHQRRSSTISAGELADIFSNAKWSIVRNISGNGGLRNAINRGKAENLLNGDFKWIGTLGMPTDLITDKTRQVISNTMESDYRSIPVYVSDSTFEGHYTHYCKQILWPTFHYQVPDNPKSKAYEDHSWIYYYKLNKIMTDSIVKNYKKGDTIWVNDYHLLLVPGMVRKQLPDARICFFLHIAFPSSEVYRCLPTRSDLLLGILGSNCVGFQTSEYCRHFLQTCNRLLAVDATPDGIRMGDRFIHVSEEAIGIDPPSLKYSLSLPAVAQWRRIFRQRWGDKKLIVSRDKLDEIHGVRQKLLAYEKFLHLHPEYRTEAVMIQVCLRTSSSEQLESEVAEITERINAEKPELTQDPPVIFLHQDIDFEQYLALISEADAFAVTSLREGMNLTCHEYIYCQYEKKRPLILSEFTGSASVLKDGSLLVNPWYITQVAEAFYQAVSMDAQERHSRWKKLYKQVCTKTGGHWASDFMSKVDAAWDDYKRRKIMLPKLDMEKLLMSYRNIDYINNKQERLIILSLEGALMSTSVQLEHNIDFSQDRVTRTLNELLQDPLNIVYAIGQGTPAEVARQFSRVSNLGIIAENGAFIRPIHEDKWISLIDMDQLKWIPNVRRMLQDLTERYPGTYSLCKNSCVEFHVEAVEDGNTKARATHIFGEIINHVNDAYESQKVHAHVKNDHVIEFKSTEWDRASSAALVYASLTQKKSLRYIIDTQRQDFLIGDDGKLPIINKQQGNDEDSIGFLFVGGGDSEDNHLFKWANETGEANSKQSTFTVSTGVQNVEAQYTVEGVNGMLWALQGMQM